MLTGADLRSLKGQSSEVIIYAYSVHALMQIQMLDVFT